MMLSLLLIVVHFLYSKFFVGVGSEVVVEDVSDADLFRVVETVPLGVDIVPVGPYSIYSEWLRLIMEARTSIKIAGMYVTLTQGAQYPGNVGGYMGQNIFNALIDAHRRGVNVQIALSGPQSDPEWKDDPEELARVGIDVRLVYWSQLSNGMGGVLHTKFMVVDSSYMYLGSANWDWRSIAQVKELGVIMSYPDVVADIEKIFDLYWFLTNKLVLPPFPTSLDTTYNLTHPAEITVDGVNTKLFLAASSLKFNTPSRTNDIDAILWNIDESKEKVCASVMDYSPFSMYEPPSPAIYWPNLDDAFRRAAFRGVQINLLFSLWPYTNNQTIQYMESLDVLHNVVVKVMTLPPIPVPFTRVGHSKFLVTEKSAYITTSNWTPDYFLSTGGVSLTLMSTNNQRDQVQEIFDRDWNSPYSVLLSRWLSSSSSK